LARKALFAASAALFLSAPLASSDRAVLAAFTCGAQQFRLLHDAGAEPFSLARLDVGGRRLLVLAVPESSVPRAEGLCATVARICGETRAIAAVQPQAPTCITDGLD
jgi:hypothetical protein